MYHHRRGGLAYGSVLWIGHATVARVDGFEKNGV
jgi:hypothetical protein